MATAGFEAAGQAPTLNPTLSSSASASAACASASASPSSSLSSQSIVFHSLSDTTNSPAESPNLNINLPYHAHRQSHNSSKLPAFRFADFKNQSPRLVLPSLLQHIPPSPVANPTTTATATTTTTTTTTPTTVTTTSEQPHLHHNSPDTTTSPRQNTRPTSLRLVHDRRPSYRQLSPRISSPIDELPEPPPKLSPRLRASTFQTASHSTPASPAISPRRPASFPDGPVIVQASNVGVAESKTSGPTRLHIRRTVTSRSRESNVTDTAISPLDTHHPHPSDASDEVLSPADGQTKDRSHGQRELLLPKTLQQTSPTDERRQSVTSRPPVSFKAPSNSTSTTSVRVAPIRSFRSSGSRRSLGLDSSTSTMRSFDFGDEFADSNQRDRTLRALEGRIDDDFRRMTPPHSASQADADDTTGDVFMKIARQEPTRRGSGDVAPAEESSAIARVTRFSHRRPLSAAVPLSYHPTSPPQISRRLSDQQETSKKRARQQSEDESAAEPMARALAYRPGLTRDRPSSVHPAEDLGRSKTFHSATRSTVSAANTPRSFTFQGVDTPESSPYSPSQYARRRPSLTDSNAGYAARSSAYRQSNLSFGQARTYNSSPLVPKMETPRTETHQQEAANGVEGTESTATASTTAPSTVWDELDDLKSRIHRLELTGKLPKTSGAAMSRASDERPPTATNTTMSTSPKRTSGSNHPKSDAISITSSQREAHQPILLSAVNKSKPFLSQPGPISSGASTIGVGTNLTDRQLRRKADSICRSLTELVLALSEESAREKTLQLTVSTPKETTTPSTPTIDKSFTGGTGSSAASGATAQQRPTGFIQVRGKTQHNAQHQCSSEPKPVTIPSTPGEKTAHRKSSLFIGRARRGASEEPEDGRRSSLLLRTRRAGTEEPEDSRALVRQEPRQESGRQTSLLRTRRGTIGENHDDDESPRFRAPSRANTELQTPGRSVSHTYHPNTAANEVSSPASSALPRRRFGASAITSRLVAPSTPSLATRRYLERTPEREVPSSAEKPEERAQPTIPQPRHFSLSHTSLLNRASSINRRTNRDSTITNTSTAAQAGSYR
uniref:Lpxtg-motif cell wall anchor domain-containing protein n=1 Tax=Colletotrichum fructicola (strain Nara gc5) TaxID=1213859 RepID=L2G502_COLFN